MVTISLVLRGAAWQMHGQNRYLVSVLAVALTASAAQAAEKSQVSCTSGDLVRRVVVEVGDLSTSLPCEVIYWKDKEAPGERRVLWNARSDAAFCDQKAAGLVNKLSTAGWQCDGAGQLNNANLAPAATAPVTTSPATVEPAAPAPAANTEAAVPAPSPSDSWNTQTAGRTLEPAAAPALQNQVLAPGASNGRAATGSTQNFQTAAVAPAAPSPAATSSAAAPVDQLETVIQANLASLNQSVDGDFKAKIGDFGDLNADGIDDAVVFFNYESSTADFTQFVAAYLYNGESYHLAATKPVGGTDLAVREVVVEDIVQGSIQLKLQLNDSSQAGDRRAAMVLKDGQLVETE
jgi:hypothetical protein